MSQTGAAFEYAEGLHGGRKNDADRGQFFQEARTCPFCGSALKRVFGDGIIAYDPEEKEVSRDVHHWVAAQTCPCGWWTVYNTQTANAHDLYASSGWTFYYHGYLRKLAAKEPLSLADGDGWDSSDPLALERRITSMMRPYHPGARWKHCARSTDGRTDLILGLGDSPLALKVERAQGADPGLSIRYVTHLIGVVLKEDAPAELVFTTREKFEFPGQAADGGLGVRQEGGLERVVIADEEVLRRFLDMTGKNREEVWKRCLPSVLLGDHGRLTPASVYLKQPA